MIAAVPGNGYQACLVPCVLCVLRLCLLCFVVVLAFVLVVLCLFGVASTCGQQLSVNIK